MLVFGAQGLCSSHLFEYSYPNTIPVEALDHIALNYIHSVMTLLPVHVVIGCYPMSAEPYIQGLWPKYGLAALKCLTAVA
jgi:hypothetical protein